MSKIFRLYKGGTDTYQGWNASPAVPYNSATRATIDDPDGASAKNEITSIPSPFARIDLVKNAFREVSQPRKGHGSANIDGNTIFHKMVSDSLDVAEIFFNIDKYQGKIQVLKWDPQLCLEQLDISPSQGHKYLADALRKYMSSDAAAYNFDKLKNIYLLNYLHGPDELNIIGATSPATLFFSNANKLDYVQDIYFKEDRPFDNEYQPLYKRDPEFIKYFFALRNSIQNFSTLFPEVDQYLTETFRLITDQALKTELINTGSGTLADLETIGVIDQQQNDLVEVLGHNLYKKSCSKTLGASDFMIVTNKVNENAPLALPTSAGNRYSELRYTTGRWGTNNAAPYTEAQPNIHQRILPFDGAVYPWLTVSDFLEPTLLQVNHKLNSKHYWDGNQGDGNAQHSFLIPLKPLFFKYFTAQQLQGKMADGRPMFEMRMLAGGSVAVTLRIPVKGSAQISYIEYSRNYYVDNSPNLETNSGGIARINFTGLVMPPVHFQNPNEAIYNVTLIQPTSDKAELSFYSGDSRLQVKAPTCRSESNVHTHKAYNYLVKGQTFDYVRISNNRNYNALIIPKFMQHSNLHTFEFAVDLGTSNTHIEYRVDNSLPRVFAFDKNDAQVCCFFTPRVNEYGYMEDLIRESEIIERDYLPEAVGAGDFRFPTRTVLSCAKTVDWNDSIEPMTTVNLPFTYEKRQDQDYNAIRYNIKWGQGDDIRVMELYVRNLMLLMRNKVLLNNGNLQATRITWFYPISMPPKRLRRLRETWDKAYREYFGPGATACMTESSAPIQYFFQRYATATSLVNIDIGGGTTDIAFAHNKMISHVTSFRYATNALFENAFSALDTNNGIVDFFKGKILQNLQSKNIEELIQVFNSPSNVFPANMASFLFSLKNNSLPRQRGLDSHTVDFNYMLQEDENFKIVFILYYSSIIYHIARIIKELDLDTPRHISFSGNGSKVIRVITTDAALLAHYTRLLIEKVLGKPYGKELEIIGLGEDANPKESTCKGGLICRDNVDGNIRTIVLKSDGNGLATPSDTYQSITPAHRDATVNSVSRFFNFVLTDMNDAFNFDRNFGVTRQSIDTARNFANRDLATFLDKGIAQRLEEAEVTDPVEETFFFYPIKGVLNVIANEIKKSLD